MHLDGNVAITEDEKVEALRLMPVPTLSRDVAKEYTMSATESSGEQLVIHGRMMQERALLPNFSA